MKGGNTLATIKDLLYRTNKIVDDEFEARDLVDWFNQCQSEALGKILYLPATVNLTISPDGLYTLPDDYKDSLEIVNSTSPFDIFGKEVRMYGETPAILTIEYNKYPTLLTTSPDQIPSIPEAFHDLYVFYGAMMAMLMDEETERYMQFREQFITAMNSLKRFMELAKSSRLSRKTGAWVVIR